MREVYGYEIPGDDTGEAWVVSAHEQGDCRIRGGRFDGQTLGTLWREHRELFGNLPGERFPLLVKIIDAKADLSIQVHPDDQYAAVNENGAMGKTECWYVLDCEEDADIVVGHHARTREELERMVQEKRFLDLIQIRPIHRGDFFQIEPGTIHAIRHGTMLLETQQNSAITYRLYDYDRLQNGKPRELHIAKSLDVISCPYVEPKIERKTTRGDGFVREELISCPVYTVERWEIRGEAVIPQEFPFLIVDVLDGAGELDGVRVEKGDHVILTAGYGECRVTGEITVITSRV